MHVRSGCNASLHREGNYSVCRATLPRFAFAIQNLKSRFERDGGRSSMVELQIVILAVAGSSPVGHPTLHFEFRIAER